MSSTTWKEAIKVLEASVAGVTPKQLELAKKLGVDLPKRVPGLVAAVLLKEAIAEELRVEDFRVPSDDQLVYLKDLAKAGRAQSPGRLTTRDQMDAWIAVMQARRAIEALKNLELVAGDLVAPIGAPDTEVDEVASISATGRIYFRGGRGAGKRPHELRVVARGADGSKATEKIRDKAATRRALRATHTGPPTQQRLLPLSPFSVGRGPSSANTEQLTDLVDAARDERTIQRYLGDHPEVLASLVVSSHGTFVAPLPRLGSEYVPDFVIAVADSAGIHYTLVEIESPRAKIALKNGQFAGKARAAIHQINSWREWLKDNLAYAQRPRESNGLGLPEIRPEAPGLVLIGRRGEAPSFKNQVVRQRLEAQSRIRVHSYDWLIDGVSSSRPSRPGGALQGRGMNLALEEDLDLDDLDLDALLAAES